MPEQNSESPLANDATFTDQWVFWKVRHLREVPLNYPRLVCIVGVAHQERINFMPASWNSPISFQPPIYGVAIAPERFTFSLLQKAQCFSISFFPWTERERVHLWGSLSGKTINKLQMSGETIQWGKWLAVPLPNHAYLSFECTLIGQHPYGDHWWIVGQIEGARFQKHATTSTKPPFLPDLNNLQPLLYFGRGIYTTFDKKKTIQVARPWQHQQPNPPQTTSKPSPPKKNSAS